MELINARQRYCCYWWVEVLELILFRIWDFGFQGCCNSKREGWCSTSNEISVQSLGASLFVFAPVDGLFMHVPTPQVSRSLPRTHLQGWFLFIGVDICFWHEGQRNQKWWLSRLPLSFFLCNETRPPTRWLMNVFCWFRSYILQVYTDGRPNISAHGRKATIRDFYGP